MGFLKRFFGKKKSESVALIHIGADSVGGAFVHYMDSQLPHMVYAKRIPIEEASGKDPIDCMQQALRALGEHLVREGAPLLFRAVGHGRIDSTLVSVTAPWQETSIRSEKIERDKPFQFSKSILQTALAKSAEEAPGQILADESVVGTILDGYATRAAVGKYASRVRIIMLTSFIDRHAAQIIVNEFKKIFHSTDVQVVAATSLRYQALRTIFPHESDYLVIDSTDKYISTALVRQDLLSAVEHSLTADSPSLAEDTWVTALKKNFESITKKYPLPRVFFLISDEQNSASYKSKIESAPFSLLRLSDEPPTVIPVQSKHVSKLLLLDAVAEADLGLELMAIYYKANRAE
jgi:hypothetical protein